jgi:methyl acetate hydrolase
MTLKHPSRRDVLQMTVAFTAAAPVGTGGATLACAQDKDATPLGRIDAVLRAATDAKEVPGLVAMAATDKGILYEGVFGTRDLAKGPAMTRETPCFASPQ